MEHLNEGFDICYKCGKSQEYGTMTDITDIGFDIYCDKCHDKIMGVVKEGEINEIYIHSTRLSSLS